MQNVWEKEDDFKHFKRRVIFNWYARKYYDKEIVSDIFFPYNFNRNTKETVKKEYISYMRLFYVFFHVRCMNNQWMKILQMWNFLWPQPLKWKNNLKQMNDDKNKQKKMHLTINFFLI